jgi:hypothetical protein
MIDSKIPVMPWSVSRPHTSDYQYLSYSMDDGRTFQTMIEPNSNSFNDIRVKGEILYRGESGFTSDTQPDPRDFIYEIYKAENGAFQRVWRQAWSDGRYELPQPIQSTKPPSADHLEFVARPKHRNDDPLTFGYLMPRVRTPSGDTRLHCDLYVKPLPKPVEYSESNPPV